MKTAIIYSRVSSDDQDYTRQIEELTDYAKKNNLKLIHEPFVDKISGTVKGEHRVGFKKMLDFIDNNKVGIILIWELSRFGRNTIDTLSNIRLIAEEKKINIWFKNENLTLLDDKSNILPQTKFQLEIMSAVASNEKNTILSRMKSGQISKVAQGGAGGGIFKPYGFKNEDKRLAIDKEEKEIVKQIYEWYLNGYGTKQIANKLNEKGIKTKYNKLFEEDREIKSRKGFLKKSKDFKWSDGTIYSILTNSIYKGERRYNGKIYKVDNIIEADIFDSVQERLRNNYNKKGINRRYTNLMKDIIFCGVCGRAYYMHRRSTLKDNSYKCLSIRYNKNCSNLSVGIDRLNNSIYHIFRTSIELANSIEKKVDNTIYAKKKEKLLESISTEEKNIISANSEKKNVLSYGLKGYYASDEVDEKMKEIINRLDKSSKKINEYKKELRTLDNLLNKAMDFSEKLIELRENPTLFKDHIQDIVMKIEIIGLLNMGELCKIFTNKQDKAVLVKIHMYNGNILEYIISQRSYRIIYLINNCISNRAYNGDGEERFESYKLEINIT